MQSLWSRAVRARRRGCRAYSTAVIATRRRAAAGRRRKPTFAEVFTACYGSVFATAALVDAIRKEDRRRELDRQLDEARTKLRHLRDQGASKAHSRGTWEPDVTDEQMSALWRRLKMIYSNRPFMKEVHKPASVSVSNLVSSLKRECYGCPAEETMRAIRRPDYVRLEQAIMAEELDESLPSREPHNTVQLLRETSSTKHLIRQLLRRAETLDPAALPCRTFFEACDLMESGFPEYTFRSIDPKRARNTMLHLNRRARALVEARKLGAMEKIGRICYNLLISSHAPDMHTYNTLIVAFDKAGYHCLADVVVHSFFHERLIRPTPSTFVAILNHYRAINDHGKFLRALACLTGADSRTGGKVARRHIEDVESSSVLCEWASNTRLRTRTGDWVWEHVPLHRALVEEVIAGLLHFKLFEQAAAFFLTCVQSGVALRTGAARQLFDECIIALDWRGAFRLIRGFINYKHKWKEMLLTGDGATNSYLVSRIYALLDLCGLQGPGRPASEPCLANLNISGPKYGWFLKALEETRLELVGLSAEDDVASHGASKDGESMAGSRSRLLQMESIWKEYVQVRRTTASIESKLLYPDFCIEFRMAMALHIGTAAAAGAEQLCQDLSELLSGGSASEWPPPPPPPPPSSTLDDCQEADKGVAGRVGGGGGGDGDGDGDGIGCGGGPGKGVETDALSTSQETRPPRSTATVSAALRWGVVANGKEKRAARGPTPRHTKGKVIGWPTPRRHRVGAKRPTDCPWWAAMGA